MKKICLLMLALVMVLSMVACGGKTNDDAGEKNPGSTPTEPTVASTEPTVESVPATEPTTGAALGEFSTGKIETGACRWQNTFVGIGCELNSDWVFLSEAEIREINRKAMNMMDEDYAIALKNATVFTDMMATNVNLTDTINVTFEKLPVGAADWSDAQYAEAIKPTTKGALQSMGMSNVEVTVGTMTFAGQTHACMDVSGYYLGGNVYEKIAIVRCGEYMVLFAACTRGTDTCQSILENFKVI